MSIDFGALTRIKNNLQLRGLKEAAPGDKAANEQAVKEFLETNRQALIDLSQATIKTDQPPDAGTIEWMNKLICLAETFTTQFGNNVVNNLSDADNGTTGALIKHDGGSMSLTLHKWMLASPDELLLFTVDRKADRQLTISVAASPKNNPTISGRSIEINAKPGQVITTNDIKLSIVDSPRTPN